MSSLQYEGISFEKRTRNDSVYLTLSYTVNGLTADDAVISWELNEQSITVGGQKDNAKLYTESQFENGVLTINLNLKDDCNLASLS